MPLQPAVNLSDHDPPKREVPDAEEVYLNACQVNTPVGNANLGELNLQLKVFRVSTEARRSLTSGIMLNQGFEHPSFPNKNDSFNDLLGGSYVYTGETVSPAALRASTATNASERDRITQLVVTPANKLNFGAAMEKEKRRSRHIDKAVKTSLNDRLLLKADSYSTRGTRKFDEIENANGCLAVGFAVDVARWIGGEEDVVHQETVLDTATFEFACGGGDGLGPDDYVEICAIMARGRDADNRRELVSTIMHGSLLTTSLRATLYQIMSSEIISDSMRFYPMPHALAPPPTSTQVKMSPFGIGGSFPINLFTRGAESIHRPTLSAEEFLRLQESPETTCLEMLTQSFRSLIGTTDSTSVTPVALNLQTSPDVIGEDETLWQPDLSEPETNPDGGLSTMEGDVFFDLPEGQPSGTLEYMNGNVKHRFNPTQIKVGAPYTVFKLPGYPWSICLLRLPACLYCSVYIMSPQSSNAEFDAETGQSQSAHKNSGVAFTRHIVPMQRCQMGAIKTMLKSKYGALAPRPILSF